MPVATIPIGVGSAALDAGGAMIVHTLSAIDGSSFSLVRLDLATGRTTAVRDAIGAGDLAVVPGAIYFSGALEPRDNVGSPAYALWALRDGASPSRLPAVDVEALGADSSHVYYITPDRELRRTAVDGSLDEALTARLHGPETEEGKLGISAGVVVTDDRVFVSLANGSGRTVLSVESPLSLASRSSPTLAALDAGRPDYGIATGSA